ncbi:MAG: hypothetical protein ACJ8AD_11920 [Gemmatimonadaceae bacterium]
MRLRSFAAAALTAGLLLPSAGAQSSVPTPASIIGFEPGTDRKLPQWSQVVAYFRALDAASPRVEVHELGKTTLGRTFISDLIGVG